MKPVLFAILLAASTLSCGGDSECEAHCNAWCAKLTVCLILVTPEQRDGCEASCIDGQDAQRDLGQEPVCVPDDIRALTCDEARAFIASRL